MNDRGPATWSPSTWRSRPSAQQPKYEDPAGLERVLARLKSFPPLVFSGEIEQLKHQLADAQEGRAFVLHGGDCAERFDECHRDTIVRKLKILLQMSLVLSHASRKPVIRIGRIAGQYAKPRSQDTESIAGEELPVYRGDLINGLEARRDARRADPQRVLDAYFHASATLNFIRALLDGGFGDLRHPEHWQLAFMERSPNFAAFQSVADRITEAIEFMESIGGLQNSIVERATFFTSHEGLHLPYEEAFTVSPPRREQYYDLSAHFLWIGDRTRQLDGAHIEFFRGIANPIGVKVGPSCAPDDLCRLIEMLNPQNEPGRLTLIGRYGAGAIQKYLPGHITAAKKTGIRALWSCDPMHGNGVKTASGIKTRSFDAILSELKQAFDIHKNEGSHLGGVHFELTGDDVTECVGGAQGIAEGDLTLRYETGCDPRLNYAQSLELAFLLADLMRTVQHQRPRHSLAPPPR
jgi:3-deoxy-7-phosphoheptulonate synthase